MYTAVWFDFNRTCRFDIYRTARLYYYRTARDAVYRQAAPRLTFILCDIKWEN